MFFGEEQPSSVVAWQRVVREKFRSEEPREVPTSLFGYSVELVGKKDVECLINKYEWLGNIGRSNVFAGLFSPFRELHGAVCFGYGPQGQIRNRIGEKAFCLERGACVHYAPPNAASFLISRACKMVYRLTGTSTFFAYADPMAGEYGAVYQASNWTYLGQGLYSAKERSSRFFVLPPGDDPDDPANWKTTRSLRRNGTRLTFSEAQELGWKIATRDAKHVYATDIGKKRKDWLKQVPSRPYPSPRPSLKMKAQTAPDAPAKQ